MSNPEKPNLEAALSSTPVAAKKSRFRPSFRSPRIPRETKLGLGIIFSLVCVFGYVLYSRLTRPADMDSEQYIAQGNSVLAPSVTSNQPTALTAQPTGASPTILPGTAPQTVLPLTNPNNIHATPNQYSAPAGGAGQASWSPNSTTSSATAAPSSDPFMNRGASSPNVAASPAASFSANGFGANSSGSNNSPNITTSAEIRPGQPASGYGLNDTSDPKESPLNSFMPPADRAVAGTSAMNASLAPSEHTATAGNVADPAHRSTAASNPSASPLDAFNKTAADSLSKLQQEGQNLVSSGSTSQQNLGKAADNAGQMLNQAQQQLGQYTNTAGNNASTMLNQAGQVATQYGTELKTDVQTQAGQYTNQLRNTAQDQFQQAQNQLRDGTSNLVNDTTSQLRTTTESVMSKAGDSTQNLMNSATSALGSGQPLTPLPTTNSAAGSAQPTGAYGMPTAQAPRTLDQTQMASQPLNSSTRNNAAFSAPQQPEQPIRIPAEYAPQPATQQAPINPPTYSVPSNVNVTTLPPSTTYDGSSAQAFIVTPRTPTTPAPATSGTPLQFNQPTVPATQPATPVYNGATRTNFEQPASSSTAPATRGVQQYTVTGQDSYYSVAEKMYGNGAMNKALYEYNRRNNPAADRLQVGGAMLIPDLATLQAQFPDLVPSTSAASTATINPTPLQFPR